MLVSHAVTSSPDPHPSDARTVGAQIRRRRLQRDWKLRSLAGRAGLTVSYLSDIERDRTIPSLPALQRIAEALETNARELLRGTDPYDRP